MLGEETVSVVVYANREIRQSLSAEDIVATADIKEMDTSTGLVPITVTIRNTAANMSPPRLYRETSRYREKNQEERFLRLQ